ncbi:MAG: TetR/AcrR family transcriptional regulator [Acidimicrobiales bacterium]|nr:TetR/AcrR family transcriptional regulator [Acidimicrobiales bacterium]MCB9392833.1 TetR/AcrR family transcriptional regulator [Acidimicrobiaceae bacterium]
MARPRTEARDLLFERVVGHLSTHGVSGLTLRELGAAIGTSHRMLVYHFGSKAALLAEVVRHVEAGQRAQIEALAALLDRDDAPVDATVATHIRAMWAHWSSPDTQRQERLFFEMVGMALQGDPAMKPLLDDLIEPWLEPVASIRRRQGIDAVRARADARLALAVTRGLLLDLLATGDLDATARAFERFGEMLEGTGRH